MIGAMFRWVKALGYLMTGQIDSARRVLDTNPYVVKAKYDEIIREKVSRIHQYKEAVAGLIAQQENKVQKVRELTADVDKLENLKAGALAKAKQSVAALQAAGKSEDEIQKNEDYMRCQAAFRDFSSTLAEKHARIDELEKDITDYGARIAEHKVQLQSLVRDLDKIKMEQTDAVADMITAKEEKELADAMVGIGKDGTAEELQRMRTLRNEVKAEARVSRELAGTDSRAQEAEFLEFARKSDSDSEFDALIGLARKVETGESAARLAEKQKSAGLPE